MDAFKDSEISIKLVREIFQEMFKKQQKDIFKLISGNRIDVLQKDITLLKNTCESLTKENENREVELILTKKQLMNYEKVQKDIEESLSFTQDCHDKKVIDLEKKISLNSNLGNEDKTKIRQLEDRQRRNNLRFEGILENDSESWDDSETKIQNLLENKLNVTGVNIERAHRTGSNLASKIGPSQTNFRSYLTPNKSVMSNHELTEDELLNSVSLLKPNKSSGADDVSSIVIIKSISFKKIPFLHIFNLSLKNGVFPENLKCAKVTPIYKTGDPSDVSNYRPISILTCFSKILERVMYNKLFSFLTNNKILYDKQFGFKSSYSTDHAIIHLVHETCKAFDENKFTLGVFIDLSKPALQKFNQVRIDIPEEFICGMIKITKNNVEEQFPSVFNRLGTIKGDPLHIVRESVTPYHIGAPRHVAFPLLEPLKLEQERM
ncbi:uncharacterized protein LOC136086214 [Hydra vulgaris]|uniref:Uncharacterized protein LOC136086214 n=1 Tax=Hydra vulgaris TaxID=6087 RepID=A0ABM4CRS5_HYDVU